MNLFRNQVRLKLLGAAAGVIALGVSSVSMPVAAADEAGWYIGAGIGQTDLNLSVSDFDDGSITSGSVDDNATGLKLFVGYRLNRHFVIEGGYVALTDDNSDNFEGISDGTGSRFAAGSVGVEVQPKGPFVAAVGFMSLRANFALLGKARIVDWDTDVNRVDSSGLFFNDDKDHGAESMYGVGVEYRFRNRVAVRGEWERFTDVVDTDMNLLSVSLSYRFGAK